MSEKVLPDFKDALAKKSVKEYKTFNGKVVRVLYGAKDADGNPIEPVAGKEDGHGEWYGIESNGEYTMFSWTKPASEGGSVEYGTSHEDHALEDLKKDIETKQELCREAETLVDADEDKINSVKEKWAAVEKWGTAKEAELEERFEKAVSSVKEKVEKATENKKAKEDILAKAQEVLGLENFKEAGNKLKELEDQFHEVGSAGETNDDELRKQFNNVRKTLNAKRKEYFENLSSRQADAKAKKEEIIAKAKEALSNVKNYKTTGETLNSYFEEWKKAGRAGKDVDDELWGQFSEIRKAFNEQRSTYFHQRSAEWESSINKKKELIEKAKEIAAKQDYSKEATDEMKQLDKEYRSAGYSGKDKNDALWKEFSEAKEVFWDAKHEKAVARFKDVVTKKEEQLKTIKKEITDLEFQVTIKPDLNSKYEIEDEIDRKQSLVDKLTKEVEDLHKKIGE